MSLADQQNPSSAVEEESNLLPYRARVAAMVLELEFLKRFLSIQQLGEYDVAELSIFLDYVEEVHETFDEAQSILEQNVSVEMEHDDRMDFVWLYFDVKAKLTRQLKATRRYDANPRSSSMGQFSISEPPFCRMLSRRTMLPKIQLPTLNFAYGNGTIDSKEHVRTFTSVENRMLEHKIITLSMDKSSKATKAASHLKVDTMTTSLPQPKINSVFDGSALYNANNLKETGNQLCFEDGILGHDGVADVQASSGLFEQAVSKLTALPLDDCVEDLSPSTGGRMLTADPALCIILKFDNLHRSYAIVFSMYLPISKVAVYNNGSYIHCVILILSILFRLRTHMHTFIHILRGIKGESKQDLPRDRSRSLRCSLTCFKIPLCVL